MILSFFLIPGFLHNASASKLQDGMFSYHNLNDAPVTVRFTWSGIPVGKDHEICLRPAEMTVDAGDRGDARLATIVFKPTDFVIVSTVLRGVESGGVTINDPPGPPISEIPLPFGPEPTRLYTFVLTGDQQFGPVTATVPIAQDGLEPNGIPRLFAARLDPETHLPLLNEGPGHCLIPTETRINDGETGEILPEFRFDGPTTVGGVLEFPHSPVGGQIIELNTPSLFIAGASAQASWIIPIAGATAAGIIGFILTRRIR
jgi:hypothetical protein